MKITLNNRADTIDKPMSVADLIKHKNYTFKLLVTKVNGKLVRKDERDTVMVTEGDEVMILHLVSGG